MHMKPETLDRLRFSTASFLRALFASSWVWERLPNGFVRSNRARFQRAARKSQDDPLGFVEKYLGGMNWFTVDATDAKLPERAAVALSEMVDYLVKADFVIDEKTEGKLLRSLLAFFRALAARPGRPRLSKYRVAASFQVLNGKTSIHNLCGKFETGYSTMSRDQQRRAREQMRSGVSRVLKATQAGRATKSPL